MSVINISGQAPDASQSFAGGEQQQGQAQPQQTVQHQPAPSPQQHPQQVAQQASGAHAAVPATAYQSHPPAALPPYSPMQATRPVDQAPQADMLGAPPTLTPTATTSNPRQRSSIACLHCRRSKIRCVNTGIDTQCNACRNSGRDCRYSVEISKRGRIGDDDADRTPKRTKSRKSDVSGVDDAALKGMKNETLFDGEPVQGREFKDGALGLVEDGILDPTILTSQVWSELFELFETHCGTDLAFLHSPTFSKRLRESPDLHPTKAGVNEQQRKSHDPSKLPGWEMLVLGILALTARFHPAVVRHLCGGRGGEKDREPVHASEHYATVLRALLVGSRGNYIGQPNLAKIQALLMLGLYEWGICNGVKAWIHVGLAIRMAQAMGLQFEDDQEYQPLALSSATRIEALHLEIGESAPSNEPLDPTSHDAFVEEEMRRRTFWSCFIMDRCLSSGKFRPSMLMLDDVRLQLPCSQNAFLFGDRVCTALIDGNCSGTGARTKLKAAAFRQWLQKRTAEAEAGTFPGESFGDDVNDFQIQCEHGTSEGILSIHVRMVEIWGRIAKWTCAGGIRTEQFAPWHDKSMFSQLNESLKRFQTTLPRLFKLSKMNIEAHIAQHTSSPYILLQILYSFCSIILHRELIPFVPVRCSSPQGPLDNASFPNDPPMPANFYVDSTRQLFKAARDVMDLVRTVQARCPLPETPVMGFGLYTVAFIEVYALNFPYMDPDGFVSGRYAGAGQPATGVRGASLMLEIIGYMRPRLPMANNWFRTIHRVHRYYRKITTDFDANSRALTSNGATASPNFPVRDGGIGIGAEGFALLEQTLKEFGSIEDEDINSWTISSTLTTIQARLLSTNGTENQRLGDAPRQGDAWTAINTADSNRPVSSNIPAPRSDYQQYAGTPSHTSDTSSAPQPPGLSRGNTPTPSAASASPYQGPQVPPATGHDGEGRFGQHAILQQQLAHNAANTSTPSIPGAYTTSHQPPTPLNSATNRYGNANQFAPSNVDSKTEPGSSAQNGVISNEQITLDLSKSLGGDDVAAFMDGLSCQEWVERADGAGAGSIGGAFGGFGQGLRDGWLTRVWGRRMRAGI